MEEQGERRRRGRRRKEEEEEEVEEEEEEEGKEEEEEGQVRGMERKRRWLNLRQPKCQIKRHLNQMSCQAYSPSSIFENNLGDQ